VLTASCHCGAVRVEVPRRPRSLTNCNCSICRRYGALWAYYKPAAVRVICEPGATAGYSWRSKAIRFVRCNNCGCITHYERPDGSPERLIGVNARNFEPQELGMARIRRLDGASSWKYLD
jgi:hypothetical protein